MPAALLLYGGNRCKNTATLICKPKDFFKIKFPSLELYNMRFSGGDFSIPEWQNDIFIYTVNFRRKFWPPDKIKDLLQPIEYDIITEVDHKTPHIYAYIKGMED